MKKLNASRRRKPNKQRRHRIKKPRQHPDSMGMRPPKTSLPNTTSQYKTKEEEAAARCQSLTEQLRLMKAQLPAMLKRLAKIPDPRQTHKIKYQLNTVLIYGLLLFVYQFGSRRQANKEMTRPQFVDNLHEFFPELSTLPHADTLYRLLDRIEVDSVQDAHMDLLKDLIKRKKFRRYLINNCYPVAVDGSQKLSSAWLWCEELLERKKNKKTNTPDKEPEQSDDYQYYVYVLEANLAFQNGMVIPLLTEFLEYQEGDSDNNKQDCEINAFKRLAKRLKGYFPKLPIILFLDGLYANGPIMDCCLQNHWQFMIVLQDNSLPSVWEEFNSLKTLPGNANNHYRQDWGDRHQHFNWVNHIVYDYGANNNQCITVNVVVCEESWQFHDDIEDKVITKRSRHAWLSSRPLNVNNVHNRCNLGARYRWSVETCFLVEKHQGYSYEHCFAKTWNALKGFHFLMRTAHALNTLARFHLALKPYFETFGVRGFIAFVRGTLTGPWLDHDAVHRQLQRPFRLQLE